MSMANVGCWQIADRLREIDDTISDIRIMLSHVDWKLADIREFAILQNFYYKICRLYLLYK